jgi:hypothetical protein
MDLAETEAYAFPCSMRYITVSSAFSYDSTASIEA